MLFRFDFIFSSILEICKPENLISLIYRLNQCHLNTFSLQPKNSALLFTFKFCKNIDIYDKIWQQHLCLLGRSLKTFSRITISPFHANSLFPNPWKQRGYRKRSVTRNGLIQWKRDCCNFHIEVTSETEEWLRKNGTITFLTSLFHSFVSPVNGYTGKRKRRVPWLKLTSTTDTKWGKSTVKYQKTKKSIQKYRISDI